MEHIVFTSRIDVVNTVDKTKMRDCGERIERNQLQEDEYFTYSLYLKNNSARAVQWQKAWACIDDGAPCNWAAGTIPAFGSARLHVSRYRMALNMAPGTHKVVWYFDGKPVHTATFTVTQTMQWEAVFPFPTQAQIEHHNRTSRCRSQYITGWLHIPDGVRYTEYSVEFRAGHLPKGTYYCLANWRMDAAWLKKKYVSFRTEYPHVGAYAGFQRIEDGRTVSIMSFWDTYCTDASGKEIELRAKLLYPEQVIGGDRFGGEGTGMRATAPYAWEAGRWYRMHLRCIPTDRDTTIVEQWCCDLETNENKLLSRYELPVADSAFMGDMAVFLENYLPKYSGEIRSLEVKNAFYRIKETGQWRSFDQICLDARAGIPEFEGSYRFGVNGNRAWMITSGVGGDWKNNGQGQKTQWLSLK